MRACPFCEFGESVTQAYHEESFMPDRNTEAKYRVICTVCFAEGPPATTPEMAKRKWDGILAKINDERKFKEALNEGFADSTQYLVWHAFEIEVGNVYEEDEYGIQELADMIDKIGKSNIKEPEDIVDAITEIEFADGPFSYNDAYSIADQIIDFMHGVNEDMGAGAPVGGVSAPMATLTNTPGVGNAVPAPEAGLNTDGPAGSGDRWDNDTEDKPKKKKKVKIAVQEGNLNPYDKIGAMMAKKMGVKQPFKKKDGKTNTVAQDVIDEVVNPNVPFKIETLDSYEKACNHVPDHPLTVKKKVNEEEAQQTTADQESMKDIKSKNQLTDLGIPFVYKPGPSGKKRVYLKMDVNQAVQKLEELEWVDVGTNPENTLKKFHDKDGKMELAIFADGKDLPRVTLKPIQVTENIKVEKLISNSLEPYMKK